MEIIDNSTNQTVSSQEKSIEWSVFFETTLLGILCLFGITGNALVIKTSLKVETKFARQIMTVFCGLAIADITMSCLRIPIHIYGLYHPVSDDGTVVCFIWNMSSALIAVIIWENLLVGIQRLMIIYNFPLYRKCFTLKSTIKILIMIWVFNWTLSIALSQGYGWTLRYKGDVICHFMSLGLFERYLYRAVVLGLQGVIPLIVTGFCHIWIVYCIIKAGLTSLDSKEESSAYIRINVTAILRTVMLLVCWLPFLIGSIVDPGFTRVHIPYQRYFEYLICLQSVLSPYITLGDSDFKETNRKRSDISRLRSASLRMRNGSKKLQSAISSCDLRTERPTE